MPPEPLGRRSPRPPIDLVCLGAGLLAGVTARALLTRVWGAVPGLRGRPDPSDRRVGWAPVMVAAALDGAVVAAARALATRAAVTGVVSSDR